MNNVPLSQWEQFKRDQLQFQEIMGRGKSHLVAFRAELASDLLAAEANAAVSGLLWKLGLRVEGV